MYTNNLLASNMSELIPPLPEPLVIPYEPDPILTRVERYGYPPREIEFPKIWPEYFVFIQPGCYLINLTLITKFPRQALTYEGTLRVEHQNYLEFLISGDLYLKSRIARIRNPDDGIPIFPRSNYRYYLRCANIWSVKTTEPGFTLDFEMYHFDNSSSRWTVGDQLFSANMIPISSLARYPGPYLEGDVKTHLGRNIGRLTMAWVSPCLRRAIIEIDRVSQSEAPLNNGNGVNWRTIFDEAGWDVTVCESNTNVTEPSGPDWIASELHDAMLDWRDSSDLDNHWRYHLLCVREIEYDGDEVLGLMFDCYGGDSNNIPREGAAISSHWMYPSTFNPSSTNPGERINWGDCLGMRFGSATGPYFRTAVHEIGHAMMMFHPSSTTGNHIMQQAWQIATNAVPPIRFPANIEWSFSGNDKWLLRHLPDVVVRPGSVLRFGEDVSSGYSGIPISPLDTYNEPDDFEFIVSPHREVFPVGAPVRVDLRLKNNGQTPSPAPIRLNFKTGQISGEVIGPTGVSRSFSTIIRYLDEPQTQILAPGESIKGSLTLLRGPDGPLFGTPGLHKIVVKVTWVADELTFRCNTQTDIMVTPPVNDDHARAAHKILTSPDTLLTLVIGGDHLDEGIQAIQAALDNPVLRPHYAYIEAKRLAIRFGKREANLKGAAELITPETVMTASEKTKIVQLFKDEPADSRPRKMIAEVLRSKTESMEMSDEDWDTLDAL